MKTVIPDSALTGRHRGWLSGLVGGFLREGGRAVVFAPAAVLLAWVSPTAIASEPAGTCLECSPIPLPGFPPVILRQTGDQTVLRGDRVLFFAETAGEDELHFQWIRDGVEILGATSQELLLPGAARVEDTGVYRLRVSNEHGAVDSNAMQLEVRTPAGLPIGPGGHREVTAQDNPSVSYDLFLPSNYDPEGEPLPLLLTYSPSGGGMVSHFRTVASELQIIVVGVTDSRNRVDWQELIGAQHSTERDLRQRVNYDATAVLAAGFSGGGAVSFNLAKRRHPHIAGVLSMGGWLNNELGPKDRYQPGLIVARTYGEDDVAALYYQGSDGDFLRSHGATIRDWIHLGGHVAAPQAIQREALEWMLEQRDMHPRDDRAAARLALARWRAEATAGRADAVATEIMNTLMTQPRSWIAQEARHLAEEILGRAHPEQRVRSQPRIGGDLAADYLFFFAYGAGRAERDSLAWGALRIFEGLIDTSGDRSSDFEEIESTFGRGSWPAHIAYPEWRQEHFAQLPSSDGLPGADITGDGIPNLAAYAMGLDPLANNSRHARPRLTIEEVEGRRMATLELRNFVRAFGVEQIVEYSRDLVDWVPFDAHPEYTGVDGDVITSQIQLPLPENGDPFFLRHRVALD